MCRKGFDKLRNLRLGLRQLLDSTGVFVVALNVPVGRWRPFRLRLPYRRRRPRRGRLRQQRSIGAQVRRHVVHDPLQAKLLKGATKPIRELAIDVKIERLAGDRRALHDLAFDGEHGAAARDLFLTFAQPVRAAKVRRDARQHIAESTRDLEPRVAVNEQLSAIGHLAAPFR